MKAAGMGFVLAGLVGGFILINRGSAPAAHVGVPHPDVVRAQSFCIALSAAGDIRLRYVIRNTSTSQERADATPWEQFGDGTAASWISDAFPVRVPAGGTRTFVRFVSYDAARAVTGCGLEWGDSSAVERIRVRR